MKLWERLLLYFSSTVSLLVIVGGIASFGSMHSTNISVSHTVVPAAAPDINSPSSAELPASTDAVTAGEGSRDQGREPKHEYLQPKHKASDAGAELSAPAASGTSRFFRDA